MYEIRPHHRFPCKKIRFFSILSKIFLPSFKFVKKRCFFVNQKTRLPQPRFLVAKKKATEIPERHSRFLNAKKRRSGFQSFRSISAGKYKWGIFPHKKNSTFYKKWDFAWKKILLLVFRALSLRIN